MRSYKYRIVHDEKWHFELLPNNSNRQYVARSSDYESKEDALEGIRKLKTYLDNKPEIDIQEHIIQNNKLKMYRRSFVFLQNECISTRKYVTRVNSIKGIQNIMVHYNSSLRSDLNIL